MVKLKAEESGYLKEPNKILFQKENFHKTFYSFQI